MTPANIEHRRTHNLLLVSKLLNQREAASPFTLVLDSLEQSARPLIQECIHRAKRARTRVVYISLETLRAPSIVDVFIPLWQHGLDQLTRRLEACLNDAGQRHLLVIDSLNALASDPGTASNLPGLLSSLLRPHISLFAVYHLDVPVSQTSMDAAYRPAPISLLRYLATSIIGVHSYHHMLAQKAARERGVAEPVFGLEQDVEGLVVGEGAQGTDGLVLELESRRKSGRGVKEWYFLPRSSSSAQPTGRMKGSRGGTMADEKIILLEDHPLWQGPDSAEPAAQDDGGDVTFSLGLSERQRQDREGVVLPYYDAQKGGGEGGRILYDMGVEDDFDEEEDEI